MCESSNSSDEMASFEVLHNHNGMPASLDSSEFSLIPDQPPTEGEALTNSSFNVSNMQSAFLSATQDLSVQEIQERVLELVKDNAAMKEALTWNNVMMKEQLSTISSWHNQMTTTMSQQQLNLKEANDKVEKLENENVKLREEIKELKSQPQDASSTEISGEGKSKENAALQLKEANDMIAELQKKIDEQNIELTTLKRNLEEKESSNELQREYEAIKTRCNDLEEEVEKRKKLIHELNGKISELETIIKLEQHAVEVEKIKHAETKELLDNTLPAYERMKKLIQVQSKDQKEKDQDMENEREKENKRHLEQIDNLTAQLFDFEEKLLEREEKVKELMHVVDTLTKESESLPILKEQVELYKSELQAAQSGTSFCSNCRGSTSSMERGRGRKMSDDVSFKSRKKVPDRPAFQDPVIVAQCPVCFEAFENAATCQAHANKCLDKESLNPLPDDRLSQCSSSMFL